MKLQNLVLLIVLSGVTACSTMNSVENAQSTGQKQMVSDKRVLTDAGLNRHVTIVGINEATVSTGFKKVQIELLNKTSSDYRFRYLVEWFDDKGMLLQTPTSGWVERTI